MLKNRVKGNDFEVVATFKEEVLHITLLKYCNLNSHAIAMHDNDVLKDYFVELLACGYLASIDGGQIIVVYNLPYTEHESIA